ncbi:hypothetical protein BDN72DRAFT_448303 [Pluteus cervinus]|uniref:Uncharacterized protein n=1 Tax=Pluteus cervinus TaxID=181527 RepID=A0ACD3BBD6_9AGAR|nr:hypothetical protein BDN72DRAFT_448303 [Pluteus cervinus]
MSKVVFVGNVPYNMGEEQLIEVFKSVGQVVGFRLVFDRDTGKPRGYGFCEFADHETAASAVRNLNNVDVGGRPLRIDLADSDPFLEGKTTVRGELVDGGDSRGWGRGHDRDRGREDPNAFLRDLPPGVPIPKGSNALDTISQNLAKMQPSQLMEVLAQMKAFVITHPDQARALLVAHPQLAYALFQSLVLNKIVDSAILQRMLEATGAASAPPPGPGAPRAPVAPHLQPHAPPPPQSAQYPTPMYPQPPGFQTSLPPQTAPANPMYPPQALPPAYYRPQTQAQPSIPPSQPAQAPPAIDETHRAMLMQVLNMPQEQVNALPEAERAAIIQLKSQFLGSIST